jgi:hypothetical protein
MKKYLFTTLAVGDSYLENSIECYQNIGTKTQYADFNITTNVELKKLSRINFDFFELSRYHADLPGFSFYLSLKSLSLKYALNKGYEYVIYNDADWRITSNFSEEKIFTLFDYMERNDLDFLFERPAGLGYYKNRESECYFYEKILDFNVKEHDLWDEAHCTNEQFLVFKVNWKFKLFVMKWEQMLWYSIANNLRSYPDGFDIGVSALESKMNWDFDEWRGILSNCFEFRDKNGNTHFRF